VLTIGRDGSDDRRLEVLVGQEVRVGDLDRASGTRGVKVRLLPGKIVHPYVRSASRRAFGKMMRAGIEIYEYQPALLHSKTIVIESFWSMIGSANLDKRSLALNEEANIAVHDRNFGSKMEQLSEDDLTRSRRVTYRDWRHRCPLDRLSWSSDTASSARWRPHRARGRAAPASGTTT
jgi:phosphatidylserine/phosphatidylglycerophosphate/cardiolipin synthase-like enzyme